MEHSPTKDNSDAANDDLKSVIAMLNLDNVAVDHLLKPCSNAQAAELLGISPGTLKNLRSKGKGPKGFAKIPGVGGRYLSRLAVIGWFREQHRQATLEPSERAASRLVDAVEGGLQARGMIG